MDEIYRYGKCRKCMERCAGGAISEQGHSNEKCRHYIRNVQPEKLKELGEMEGLIGMVITCGLCWTGVPCEDRIPVPEVLGN